MHALRRSQSRAHLDALREIGDNPDSLDHYHDYSASTKQVLRSVQIPVKTYLQQGIAYGVCAFMLLAGGAVIVLIAEDELALAFIGALTLMGGALLGVLTYKALRN